MEDSDSRATPPPQTWVPGSEGDEMVLSELVSRVLDRGVVVAGEVTISVAGIDLVHLGLRLQLSAVESLARRGDWPPPEPGRLPPGSDV